jgi:hypothetical protein
MGRRLAAETALAPSNAAGTVEKQLQALHRTRSMPIFTQTVAGAFRFLSDTQSRGAIDYMPSG